MTLYAINLQAFLKGLRRPLGNTLCFFGCHSLDTLAGTYGRRTVKVCRRCTKCYDTEGRRLT